MENVINYTRLTEALDYYTKVCGFIYKDVSWLVNEEISNITKPDERKNFFVRDKVLVASAEQSFLQKVLIDKSLEYDENYIAITPCFRDEPVLDELHNLFFMKAEMFCRIKSTKDGYKLLDLYIRAAQAFFERYNIKTKVVDTGCTFFLTIQSYDIIDEKTGIELGSYSLNELKHEANMWVCGTGLAEPRFSVVLNKQ